MAVPLTADICAQAIVAACGVYGKDPLASVAAARAGRTPLIAAASATRKVTGATVVAVSRVFQVHQTTINKHERTGDAKFRRAVRAAWEAITVEGEAPASDRVGTVVAPPPAALKAPSAPAPVAAPPKVDHRAAIAAAMARRTAQAQSAPSPSGCHWAIRPGAAMDDTACAQAPVVGRLFCPVHCRALGQKDTPVLLSPPDMPQRYTDQRAVG